MNPLRLVRPLPTPTAVLLTRFTACGDGEAFALLVHQFGPLVLATCRRVLGQSADANDAFQAVFLTLARRADAIRDAAALPAWLHRVSLRTAKMALARRVPTSPLPDAVADPNDPFAELAWKDLRRVLDEELDRLPEKYRGPLVLCLLEGRTQEEAARLQATSVSTLKRRLLAGRELLHERLVRRGIAPVLLAAAVLEPSGLRAVVPSSLREAAVRLAEGKGSVPSAIAELVVAPLTAGMGRSLSIIAAVVMAAVAVAVAGWIVQSGPELPAGFAGLNADPAAVQKPDSPPLPTGVTARFGSLGFRTPDSIFASALSPDGKVIAVAEFFRVSVYEAATWKRIHVLDTSREGGVWVQGGNLTFSRDGKYLGYVRNGESAYVWDLRTGKLMSRYNGEAWRWNYFCEFTGDGLFALSDKGRLYFYDPATGREVRSFPTASAVIAMSPDGGVIVRPSKDEDAMHLTLGSPKPGAGLKTLDTLVRQTNGNSGVAFSPDGKSMTLLPAHGKELQVWDVATRSKVKSFPTQEEGDTHWRRGQVAGWLDGGKTVWVKLSNSDIARFQVETGQALPRLVAGKGPALLSVHALPDNKTILTPTTFGWVRVWDSKTGKEIPVAGRYGIETRMTLAPDGKTVAVGDLTGRIDLLDAVTGVLVRTIRPEGHPIHRLTFSPDGGWLAVGERWTTPDARQARCLILDIDSGRVVRAIEPVDSELAGGVWIVGFLGETGLAVVADTPGNLRVIEIKTGTELRRFKSHSAGVAPDGMVLAYEAPGEVVLADPRSGKEIRRAELDAEEKKRPTILGAYRLAWSANGKTLAVGLPGQTVAVLDPETGRVMNRFAVSRKASERDHHGRRLIRVLAMSPDGKLAVVVLEGWAWSVGVWDTTTGQMLAGLPHDFHVDGAVFTRDGKGVITHGSAGVGYRWDLDAVIAATKK